MNLTTSFKLINIFNYIIFFRSIKKEFNYIIEHLDSQYPLHNKYYHARLGSIKLTDAFIVNCILSKHKPNAILEIGAFLGFSTRLLLEGSKEWNAKVTSIDPNIRHRIFDNPSEIVKEFNKNFYPNNLEIINAFFGSYDDFIYKSYENHFPIRDRTLVDELIRNIDIIDDTWKRKFDLIFIDADHSYKSVINQFNIAIKLLNKNGIIIFHDAITWDGVKHALQEISCNYKGKAIVEIYGKIDRYLNFLFLTSNDGIGFFKLIG